MENKIGKKISKLRSEKGMNQRELANVLGVSNGAIGMWETGKREPDLDMVSKIAAFFNVSVDFLVGNTEQAGSNAPAVSCPEIAKRVSDLASSSHKNINELRALLKTQILSGYCSNMDDFMQDVYTISDFFGVTDEYILGGKEFEARTDYSSMLDANDSKFLSLFRQLNECNRDIIFGDMQRYLKEQRYEESVAAEPLLKQAK